ncbi:MAG: hypothetical protein IJ439_05135 [Tyzzerella sp.]|nr:hypothetical protein [Tyzzerella sp.]
MKPLSKKRVFILTMFLWVIDVVCVVLLALNTRPLTTILLGIAWTNFFGYLVWRMIDRIETN